MKYTRLFLFNLILDILKPSLCCLYESRKVGTSLENAIFVGSARSIVECILQCQSLKKTPFYTDEEKCHCLDSVGVKKDGTKLHSGTIFQEVKSLKLISHVTVDVLFKNKI